MRPYIKVSLRKVMCFCIKIQEGKKRGRTEYTYTHAYKVIHLPETFSFFD